ncbi:MAG: HD domain-containing protein [Clostridia bacterium]|nr:HD domain-containing protein [Clostridia bacterium]
MADKKIRQIYDNLYGYITFDKEKFEFILKDSFFLRLHNLKQMGLGYYVYPDALHTRFAHSLGVYCNITKIIESQKQYTGNEIISDDDIYKIQLSGLLHDIGHLPLSHTFEEALQRFDKYENNCEKLDDKNKVVASNIVSDPDDLPKNKSENSYFDEPKLHEKLGEFVLGGSEISHQLEKRGISYLDIANGFKGFGDINSLDKPAESMYDKQIRNFLHSQLDADRLDYLLRDSGFSGVKTGSFDIDKLLNSIVYDEKANYGIDESGIRALEQFLMGRFVAYCQVVANKKVMAFEFMAQDFYFRLLKLRKEQNYHLGIRLYSYKDLVKDVLIRRPEEFLNFTDDYFFSLIREVMANKRIMQDYDPIVVKYAEMITNIQPLVPVTYFETFYEGMTSKNCFFEYLFENPHILDIISEESEVERDHIIFNKPFKVSLYKNDIDPIQIFRNREAVYQDVSECKASILNFLVSREYRIYRIYTFDSNEAIKLKVTLAKHAKGFEYKGDLKD